MAIQIKSGCKVQMTYRLLDTAGSVLEEKTPDSPYEYIQGEGQILPAIERIVEGKTAGYQFEVQLSPREAYGEYNSALVTDVKREVFPAEVEISQGMKFSTQGPTGRPVVVRVLEVDDEVVTIDGNHPLAGIEIIFELRILEVTAAERGVDGVYNELEVAQASASEASIIVTDEFGPGNITIGQKPGPGENYH
jgi:FKBP-type peptidyl-prolyl cis-trans isomerase SlyD